MKKFFTLSLLLATAISASSANGVNILRPSEKAGGFMASGISTNGEYVCGNSSVWNVSTGEVVTAEDSNVVFESISNTGIAVGNALDYAVSMDLKGNLTYLDDMASGTFSTARGISGDGKIIVGSRFDDAYHQIPCYWEEGTYQPLPLPDKYEDMPDVVEVYSVAAVSINEDGSVIAGNVITGTGAEAVIMWTRNEEGEYEFHPLYSGMM
ncbi:MAG: hypothetical protein K2H76_04810, partial [Muribaculaceae bacterium]|nr:hypothetical protein [Muribaculaceae bacterium]